MKFKRLKFIGAGKYSHKVRLDLDAGGRILIIGRNGSGKSTIWNVMCYLLFGRTPSGHRGNTIVGEPGFFEGSLTFEYKGHDYKVKHKRYPSKNETDHVIYKDNEKKNLAYGVKDGQKYVSQVLGYNIHNFVGSTLIPQGFFHSLVLGKPTERMNYLTGLIGLDIYDALYMYFKDKRSLSLPVLDSANISKSRLDDAKNALKLLPDVSDDITKCKKQLSNVTAELKQARAYEAMLARKVQADKLRGKLPKKPTGTADQIDMKVRNLTKKIEEQLRRIELESLDAKPGKMLNVGGKIQKKRNSFMEKIGSIKADIAKLSSIDGGICMTCLRPYPEDDKQAVIHNLKDMHKSLVVQLTYVTTLGAYVDQHNRKVQKANAVYEQIATLADGKPEDTESRLRKLRNERTRITEYNTIARNIKNLESGVKPVPEPDTDVATLETNRDNLINKIGRLREQQSQRAAALKRKDALEKEAKALEKEAKAATRCKLIMDVVKDMKTMELRSVLQHLQTLLPTYVNIITKRKPTFNLVESGKGIEIIEMRGDVKVPFDLQSGGETCTLSIAMIHALHDMAPIKSNLLVLDEVGFFLEAELKARLPDLFEAFPVQTLFCTSHDEALIDSPIWASVYHAIDGQLRRAQ